MSKKDIKRESKTSSSITFRIPAKDSWMVEFLDNKSLFKTQSEAVKHCISLVAALGGYHNMEGEEIRTHLDSLEHSRVCSLREIADKFLVKEWSFIYDVLKDKHNQIIGAHRFSNNTLIGFCKLSDEILGLAVKHKIDSEVLYEKIKSLTSAQVDAIHAHIENYCENPKNNSPKPDSYQLMIIGNEQAL